MANALEHELVERIGLRRDRGGAVWPVGDQLRNHRIVVDRDLATLDDPGVDADHAVVLLARCRRTEHDEAPCRRHEVANRIFRIDACFDGPAPNLDTVLPQIERLAGGDTDHLLHQVDPGDELGHGVLDL